MRITVYLARGVLGRSAAVFLLVAVVYVAVDFVEASSLVQMPLGRFAAGYPYRLLSIVCYLLPLALMLGALLALGASRGRGELVALGAAGLSPARIHAALLAVPGVGALVSAALLAGPAPAALHRWQQALDVPGAAGKAGDWCLADRWIALDDEPSGLRVAIGRDSDGSALSWGRGAPDGTGPQDRWRRGRGWIDGMQGRGAATLPDCAGDGTKVDEGSPLVLPGATLTFPELAAAIGGMRLIGRDPAPLEAERALRIALSAFCLVLPLLGLALAGREGRPALLVARGLVIAALGWLALAAAWHGVAQGVFHPLVLSAGVSFAGLSVGAVLLCAGSSIRRRGDGGR
jgi:lipopolysaccharide export LptBFGC system permease protein LptF